jgi:hypothetical protein
LDDVSRKVLEVRICLFRNIKGKYLFASGIFRTAYGKA